MNEVLLELAFSWKCPVCDKRNFVNGVAVEWMDEDLREHLGLQHWESIPDEARNDLDSCVMAPRNVSCVCGYRGRAIDPGVDPISGV